jgi:hypothetical protein
MSKINSNYHIAASCGISHLLLKDINTIQTSFESAAYKNCIKTGAHERFMNRAKRGVQMVALASWGAT